MNLQNTNTEHSKEKLQKPIRDNSTLNSSKPDGRLTNVSPITETGSLERTTVDQKSHANLHRTLNSQESTGTTIRFGF